MTRTVFCIVVIWCAAGLGLGLGLGRAAIGILSILYVMGTLVLFARYRTSRFGRTWVPRLVRQYFEWPPLVRLRSVSPPFGAFVANATGVALAVHLPLILWCAVPSVVVQVLGSRAGTRL